MRKAVAILCVFSIRQYIASGFPLANTLLRQAQRQQRFASRHLLSNMADREVQPGDHVAWSTSNGQTQGEAVDIITEDTKIKRFTAKASEENPKVLVKSDKTGSKAAHKPESLEVLDD
ncbi:hypothetical protein JKP88DRAFT_218974 [Tribonema minus]|uniref:Hypervirulence associated protein TUDOR domain-containing protein n=1 Tax=Tribonema minus TaxID=303371 RepID=A0A835Z364_9STRA|nr:hypothetical protein JKP88DRAFT_218974 [Tribonema minus]